MVQKKSSEYKYNVLHNALAAIMVHLEVYSEIQTLILIHIW